MITRLNLKNRKKGQAVVEYVLLIIIVIAALLSMQAYMKRSAMGRYKDEFDRLGSQFSAGNTNVIHTVTTNSHTNESQSLGSGSRTTMLDNDRTSERMEMNIINVEQEFWGKRTP